jgi:hypothetical protein
MLPTQLIICNQHKLHNAALMLEVIYQKIMKIQIFEITVLYIYMYLG